MDEGGPSGASLRSTRGPTSGWELPEPGRAAVGLLLGEDLVAFVGPEAPAVSVSAALKFSATELAAAEGGEVASALAGLFVGGGEGRRDRWEKSEEKKKCEM